MEITTIVTYRLENGRREIVDGFHRNRVGREHNDIKKRIHGYLPVSTIDKPQDERIGSTIRHNRARGTHGIRPMSDIVLDLSKIGWTDEKICKKLGMDLDEVIRLKQITGLKEAFANNEFSHSWEEFEKNIIRMVQKMTKYEVGQRAFPPTGEDSLRFQIYDSGCTLVLSVNKPTAAEKRNFKSGIQTKVAVVNDIVFLLVRFGVSQWMDAPFYRELSPHTHLDIPDEGQGLTIHCMLVDSSTGILIAQKLIGLDHDVSCRLISAITAQPKIDQYDSVLAETYRQYTTQQLLDLSDSQC